MRYPDFYIIGAMKAGTTSLYTLLDSHKQIHFGSSEDVYSKEPGYFSRDERFQRGPEWYLEIYKEANENQLIGDASTCYSRWPFFKNTVERIFSVTPNAKFIYIIREPVQRTYSHYRHRMLVLDKITTFSEYIDSDEEMMCASDYALQIKQYLKYFKRSQLHFLTLDQLKNHPNESINNICKFLNIDSISEEQIKQVSQHQNPIEDRINTVQAKKLSNNILSNKFITPLSIFIPTKMKAGIRAWIADTINSIYSKRDTNKYLNKISSLEPKEIEVLNGMFAKSITETEELTGLDLSDWKA